MTSRTVLKVAVWLILGLAAMSPLGALSAQVGQSRKQAQLAEVPKGLSGGILRHLGVMGARFRVPGKEESDYAGELEDDRGGKKNLRIVHQLSGVVQIDVTEKNGRTEKAPVKFDGAQSQGFADRLDESLLETFVTDTFEGLIYSIRDGAHVKLLGRGFKPDSQTFKDYAGPSYDIYEVIGPLRTRQDRQLRLKYYYFDSQTGFLLSTRYTDPTVSPGIRVETRFSDWREVDGSAYPGRIERYEEDRRVFSFNASTVTGRDKKTAANLTK